MSTFEKAKPPIDRGPEFDAIVARKKREETAPRQHAYLMQTRPPNNPEVREIEHRRSGADD